MKYTRKDIVKGLTFHCGDKEKIVYTVESVTNSYDRCRLTWPHSRTGAKKDCNYSIDSLLKQLNTRTSNWEIIFTPKKEMLYEIY